MNEGKSSKGALNVRFPLSALNRILKLDGQKVVYAGDFDYLTQSIKLTVTGEGLPVPREGCVPDDGWLDYRVEADGSTKYFRVVAFNPHTRDIGG